MSYPPGTPNQQPYGQPSATPYGQQSATPFGQQPAAQYGQPMGPQPNQPYGGFGQMPGYGPQGMGATPPAPPKKGFPVWALIAIPLALLLLIGGGVLLALQPWREKESAGTTTTTSAPVTSATSPTMTEHTDLSPSPTSPGSTTTAPQSPSTTRSASPTGGQTPVVKPASTKTGAQITTLPDISDYKMVQPLPASPNRLQYRLAQYFHLTDTSRTLAVKVHSDPLFQTKNMTRTGLKEIEVFENFACGKSYQWECVADLAGTDAFIVAGNGKMSKDEVVAKMREVLPKVI